ncbi:unnamed protein product [Rotaria magnacalcarata]|nr:unnamed protein product [Rotaria magnacalcarata]CAF5185342.1 unnamed protein product [Rotaria magnacalcarata]
MKYPSRSDKKWSRNDLATNEKIEYYLEYLKQHRNAEIRVENAVQLCNQSKSIDLSILTICFQKDLIPIVEHFLSNATIIQATLELLAKIIQSDLILTSQVVSFVTKLMPPYENNEELTKKIGDILIALATQNTKLLTYAQIAANLVRIMTKYENNADISARCCTLIWLMAKDAMS